MRVFLRHPEMNDAAAFVEMVQSSRRLHRPWVHAPDSPDKFERFVQKATDGRNESFLVCRNDEAEIAGVINLSEIIRGSMQGAFVGYYGAAEFERQGYMTDGLLLVIRHAFRNLRLHRLEANIQPGNAPSIALARRCGFTKEGFSARYLKIGGRWRDHERWAILSDTP